MVVSAEERPEEEEEALGTVLGGIRLGGGGITSLLCVGQTAVERKQESLHPVSLEEVLQWRGVH